MPLTRVVADIFGVVTISLVSILILVGLVCIFNSLYFRFRVCSQGFVQLSYFSGPWIIRITFVLFAIWWGIGEIIRLSFLRREGRVLNALNLRWQETICKCYVVSNLGFAEPCLFLTLAFLLRAPLRSMESGLLSRHWNGKTAGCILLYCFPLFILQLFVILVGPQLNKDITVLMHMPQYFTRTTLRTTTSNYDSALCIYPLLSTASLGIFAVILTSYLLWLGRKIFKLAINRGIQKRVYTLIFSVSCFLPLRVVLLGLSVLSKPEHLLFEALAFFAFIALLCCIVVCICMLVYYPLADSLVLWNLKALVSRERFSYDHNEAVPLVSIPSSIGESSVLSQWRNSDGSAKCGSISFPTLESGGTSGDAFIELSLFSPSQVGTSTQSPPLLCRHIA